jgi:membrane associated rhomboid family serine protease/Zn-finger nucleic acid-binding protein
MHCPVCRIGLDRLSCDGIKVDSCPECRGIWLNAGDLKPYIDGILAKDESIPHDSVELHRSIVALRDLGESMRPCPHCNEGMNKFNYAADSNIILDKCSECEGLWVDEKEILELAIFAKGNPLLDRLGTSLAGFAADRERKLEKIEILREINMRTPVGGRIMLPIILPLRDDLHRTITPFVTFSLIVLNVLGLGAIRVPEMFETFGLVPADLLSGENYHGILTYIFFHGSVLHLIGNMWYLWVFGGNIEESFGHIRFLFFFLFAGLVAGFAHVAVNPDSVMPCIGASGAISGILGAYQLLHPSARIRTFVLYRLIDIPAQWYIGFWLALQLVPGIVIQSAVGETHIAFFTHIGGFIAGIVIAHIYRTVNARKRI